MRPRRTPRPSPELIDRAARAATADPAQAARALDYVAAVVVSAFGTDEDESPLTKLLKQDIGTGEGERVQDVGLAVAELVQGIADDVRDGVVTPAEVFATIFAVADDAVEIATGGSAAAVETP